MKKKMNLTAIIAVAMVAMNVLVLGSCNADDSYNEFDYGTLAKGMITRAGDVGTSHNRSYEKFDYQLDNASFASVNYTPFTIQRGNISLNVYYCDDINDGYVTLGPYSIDSVSNVTIVENDVRKEHDNNIFFYVTINATGIKEHCSEENPDSIVYDTILYVCSEHGRILYNK